MIQRPRRRPAMPASGAGRVEPSISQPTGSMCGPIVQSMYATIDATSGTFLVGARQHVPGDPRIRRQVAVDEHVAHRADRVARLDVVALRATTLISQ